MVGFGDPAEMHRDRNLVPVSSRAHYLKDIMDKNEKNNEISHEFVFML